MQSFKNLEVMSLQELDDYDLDLTIKGAHFNDEKREVRKEKFRRHKIEWGKIELGDIYAVQVGNGKQYEILLIGSSHWYFSGTIEGNIFVWCSNSDFSGDHSPWLNGATKIGNIANFENNQKGGI